MSARAEVHLITGKWASGKTYACSLLAAGLASRGLRFISDRTALEDGVLFDHGKADPTDGQSRPPRFSDVTDWGTRGSVQFTVRDGYLLNVARTAIVRAIKDHLARGAGVLIAEVAIGPDVLRREGAHGVFAQTTEDLVERLEAEDVRGDGSLRFVQLEAPYDERLRRQGARSDAVARRAFDLYAGDGGELVRHPGDDALVRRLQALGWSVRVVGNDGIGEHVARALEVPPLDAEEARQVYARLLSSAAVISVPARAFDEAQGEVACTR